MGARTDSKYPAGFMDVVSIEKTNEFFRLLYDVRGRFALHGVSQEEAKFKLARVKDVSMGQNAVPYVVTHDGRTIRYPNPDVCIYDTIKLDLDTGKMIDHVKFESGNLAMISGGNVFVIGKGNRPLVSLPKRKGIKMSILEERAL